MAARTLALDVCHGCWDSLQAVRFMFSIDKASTSTPPPALVPTKRALTVLEVRRQRQAIETNTPIAPTRAKPVKEQKHVLRTIVWLIVCNWAVIGSIGIVIWLSGLTHIDGWTSTLINLTTTALAIALFVTHAIMRLFNCLWFSDVSQVISASSSSMSRTERSLSVVIADFLMATVIDLLFYAQSFVPVALADYGLMPPTLAYIVQMVHVCLLMSLYSFEYNWMERGKSLDWRLQRITQHWAYMLGYGMPITLLSTNMVYLLPESSAVWQMIASQCAFAAAFPLTVTAAYFAPDPPSLSAPIDEQYFSLPIMQPVTIASQSLSRAVKRWALGGDVRKEK